MESMLETLNECLKDANLETVSKAELRKKYLEKTGLPKLAHEDKKLFISAVNTAYLNYIAEKSTTGDIADKIESDKESSDEIKENSKDWKLTISSSSDDDITPQNIKEKFDQVINGKNDTKEISGDEMKNNKHQNLEINSTPDDNISIIQENVLDKQFVNGLNDVEMDSSNDFDEKSLTAITNGYKKLSGKRSLISSSEDEVIQLKPTKRKKVSKSSDLEVQPAIQSEKGKKLSTVIKNKVHLKKALVVSSDSEEEPLSVFQKKSNSCESFNSVTKAGDSENENLSKSTKKHSRNLDSENCSSDSEAEPLIKFQTSNFSSHSNRKKMKLKTNHKSLSNGSHKSIKSKNSSGDSEDEPLTKYKKCNDSIPYKNANSSTKDKLNSSNKFTKSFESTSESEDDFLTKNSKRKVNNFIDLGKGKQNNSTKKSHSRKTSFKSVKDSSDSEDKPLHSLSNKKTDNSIVSKKKPIEKTVKKKVKQSLKKNRIVESEDDDANTSNQKKENSFQGSFSSDSCEDEPLLNIKKKHREKFNSSNKFAKSFESTSESEDEFLAKNSKGEEQLNSNKKTDSLNNSFKSVKDSSNSEDEPLLYLGNKQDNAIASEGKPNEKTVKKKVKQFSRKMVESDDANISNQKKEKNFQGSLSSDSCEDEPLSNMKKKRREKLNSSNKFTKSFESTSESEDEFLAKNLKGEERLNNSNEKIDSLNNCFKSVEDSSNSEDEPLRNLGNKKDNAFAPEGKPNKKTLRKKVKQFSKKKRIVESDDDANISNQKKEAQGSLLSDSCEDEPLSSMKREPNNSSDSDNEPLHKLSAKKLDKIGKSSESSSSSFVDENEEQSIKKNKLSKRKEANDPEKVKKRPTASENKIEHLKKYLRVAGIRITNYNKLFENCRSMKAKCEKMMSLLEKEGLKGRPTLEKCKKLRVKIETKREIAELDVSNILRVEGGRPKRGVCSDTTNCKQEKSSPIKKFLRLQDIVDSEESD